MNIIEKIKSLLSKDDVPSPSLVRLESTASFVLMVDRIKVGFLSNRDGMWEFSYTDEFRDRSEEYHAIVGFPDLNKTYQSVTLWPFFQIRIPGLKQPAVQEVLKKESINANNQVDLLKRFGRKSISNPYELVFSA